MYLSLVLVLVLISVVSADNYECEQIIKTPGKGHIDFELGACKSEDCDAFNDILNEFSCDYDYYEFSAYTMSHEYINSKILDMVDEDEDYIGNWNVALDEQPVVVEMVDDAKCDIDDIKETLDFISDYENKGFTKDQVICDPICGIQDVAWLDEENKLFFLMNLDNIDEDISWVFAEPFSWADWPIGDSPEVLSYSVLGFTETSHATDQGNSGKDSPSIGFSYNIKDEITSETNSGSLEHLYVLAGDCNNYFKNDDGEYYFSEGLLEDWQTCEVRRKGTTDATVTGAIYAETAGCDAGASVTVDQLFYCSENGEKISLKSVNTLPCNNVDNAYINDWFKIGDVPDDQISFDDVYFVAKYDWTKQTLPDSDELDKEDVFVRVAMLKENSNVVHGLSCGPSSISDVSQVPITKYKDLFNAAGELSGQTDYRIGFGTFYDEDDGQNMNAQGTSYFNSPFYTGYGNFRGQITKDDSESCCFAGKSISGISVQLISDLLLNDEMKLAEDKVLCYSGELYLWPPCEYINFD